MKTDRNTLKSACYQYLLDHSYPMKKGPLVVFYLPKKAKFYKKVMAREQGYSRKAEKEILNEYKDFMQENTDLKKEVFSLRQNVNFQRNLNRKHLHFKANGTIYQKLILWLKEKINKRANKFLKPNDSW